MRKEFMVDGKKVTPRKGKFVAQGAHACLKAILDSTHEVNVSGQLSKHLHLDGALLDWINGRFTKICLSIDTEEELLAVYNKAKEKGLMCSLITDAGLTEFNGTPTITCCAIGPAWSDEIDEITSKLSPL